ncbi:Hypothetical predicted protein [Paramuricea clavata]|uniref:Uncharacterized protein n=1 Tax=Paramuricea clavata TaxID=317549 RepID=A0A6S7HD28_PARCT|nr:Hypothetical predicted protein [Paramuricea clavata]
MKSITPTHIESKYPNEMVHKSTIIPLSSLFMQFKEEKKYDDVVNILSTYENTLEDIYSKAKLIKIPKGTKPAAASNVSLSGVASHPDQPGAHAEKNYSEDHMKDVQAILGLKACEELKVIRRVEEMSKTDNAEFEAYEDVFSTGVIGCLPVTHHIEIDKNVKPVVHALHQVPAALRPKIQAELDRMEKLLHQQNGSHHLLRLSIFVCVLTPKI